MERQSKSKRNSESSPLSLDGVGSTRIWEQSGVRSFPEGALDVGDSITIPKNKFLTLRHHDEIHRNAIGRNDMRPSTELKDVKISLTANAVAHRSLRTPIQIELKGISATLIAHEGHPAKVMEQTGRFQASINRYMGPDSRESKNSSEDDHRQPVWHQNKRFFGESTLCRTLRLSEKACTFPANRNPNDSAYPISKISTNWMGPGCPALRCRSDLH